MDGVIVAMAVTIRVVVVSFRDGHPRAGGFPHDAEASAPTHALQLSAGDGCDVEEPTRGHGFLPQTARAPGQNKKHRARELCGLGRIARPPKRRGMYERQIAFDQRLQNRPHHDDAPRIRDILDLR
jgi:hypothetical protein